MTAERWKELPDYEGIYSVSDQGRVRRNATQSGRPVNRIMSMTPDGHGYTRVSLYMNSRTSRCKVHQLVAAAFLPSCPDGCQINHKDGTKKNNAASNLEYVTPSQNIRHAYLTKHRGPPTDPEKVQAMRRRYAEGYSLAKISRCYGHSLSGVSKIINRKRWAHLPDDPYETLVYED